MFNLTHKLLHLTLLSAFAVTATGSVMAEERHGDKRDKQAKQERPDDRHGDRNEDRHDERHSGKDDDSAGGVATVKTCVITVSNRGMAPLTITEEPSVRRTSGPGNFSIIPPSTGTRCATSLVVAPHGECTIGVQYSSTSQEVSRARLRLTDSGAETSTQETEIMAN